MDAWKAMAVLNTILRERDCLRHEVIVLRTALIETVKELDRIGIENLEHSDLKQKLDYVIEASIIRTSAFDEGADEERNDGKR